MIPCAILLHCHDLDDVQALVTATQYLDEHQIRRGRIGHIYTTGVRYRREEHETLPGVERVQTAEEAGAMGDGDCDDLAPWLAASRRVLEGVNARAKAVDSPGIGYHVVVEYDDGRIEDPSARLGMLEGTIAGKKADRRARLRRLSGQLLGRASELAQQAARANPYTAAGRALIAQARNHLARAKGAAAAADELEADELEAGDGGGDDGGDDGGDEASVSGRRGKARRRARHAKRHGGGSGGGSGGGDEGGGARDDAGAPGAPGDDAPVDDDTGSSPASFGLAPTGQTMRMPTPGTYVLGGEPISIDSSALFRHGSGRVGLFGYRDDGTPVLASTSNQGENLVIGAASIEEALESLDDEED